MDPGTEEAASPPTSPPAGSGPSQGLNNSNVGSGGVNSTMISIQYQVRLLMLFILKCKDFDFSASTEVEQAEKFDDAVIQIPEKGSKLLQAKFKVKTDKLIAFDTIMSSKDYGFDKYYESLVNMKMKGNFSDATDLILCTNISFPACVDGRVKLVKGDMTIILEKQSSEDEVFGLAERYKFSATDADTRKTLAKHLEDNAKKLDQTYLNEFIEKFTFIANYQMEALDEEIKNCLEENFKDFDIDYLRQQFEPRIDKWVKGIKQTKHIFDKTTLQDILDEIEVQSKIFKFAGETSNSFETEEAVKFSDPLGFFASRPSYLSISLADHDYETGLEEIFGKLKELYPTKHLSSEVLNQSQKDIAEKKVRLNKVIKRLEPSQTPKNAKETEKDFKEVEKQLLSFIDNKDGLWDWFILDKDHYGQILQNNREKILESLGKMQNNFKQRMLVTLSISEHVDENPNIQTVTLKQSLMRKFLTEDVDPKKILCIKAKPDETMYVACEVYNYLEKQKNKLLFLQTTSFNFSDGIKLFKAEEKIKVLMIEDSSNPGMFKQIKPELLKTGRKVLIISNQEVLTSDDNVENISRGHVTLSELDRNYLQKQLEKEVKFQENTEKTEKTEENEKTKKAVKLKEILDTNNANLLATVPLTYVENVKTIGGPIPKSEHYNEAYYILRTFRRETILSENVEQGKGRDYELAKTKQEFEEMKKRDPKKNVHWVQKLDTNYKWMETHGSIDSIMQYIVPDKGDEISEQLFLEETSTPKFVVLVNDAGMGKTTVLNKFAQDIKKTHPSDWVLNVTLNFYTNDFQKCNSDSTLMNANSVIDFLQDKVLKLETEFEKILFRAACKNQGNIQVILDGADEVAPDYEKCVHAMLFAIKNLKLKRLLISTRPELGKKIEKTLQQFRYSLLQFTKENQINFCVKYWKSESDVKDEKKLEEIAEIAIEATNKVIDRELISFSGLYFIHSSTKCLF